MSTTGRFRADLIAAASKAARERSAATATTPTATPVASPYGHWLDRMQRTRGRHAAISRNLNTWASYKSWSERVRDSWDSEVSPSVDSPRRK